MADAPDTWRMDTGKSHGGEVCLPWILSASSTDAAAGGSSGSSGGGSGGGFELQYGLLWNMPNYGNFLRCVYRAVSYFCCIVSSPLICPKVYPVDFCSAVSFG